MIRTEDPAHPAPLNPLVKLALEMGPLVIFFIVNQRGDIFTATAVFTVATVIALSIHYVLVRKLPVMPLVSTVVVVVFGGLTLLLQDELFIKLKPTIVNTLFGIVLLVGLYFGKPLLTVVLDSVFKLTDEGWHKLTFRWGLFFFFLAALNEVVWRTQTTDFWVSFKVFGIMPITIAFALAQTPLLMRHELPENEEAETAADAPVEARSKGSAQHQAKPADASPAASAPRNDASA
jgi:intracellular septation protein